MLFFLGNKDFVIEFLRRGYSVVCILCGLSGKNCPGKINIPHQNPNWPINRICLACCCFPSTHLYYSGIQFYLMFFLLCCLNTQITFLKTSVENNKFLGRKTGITLSLLLNMMSYLKFRKAVIY